MRDDYDFSASTRNPHSEELRKKPATLWLDEETVVYFKQQAEKTGLPYQRLIRLQLVEWARSQRAVKCEESRMGGLHGVEKANGK